VLGVFGDKHGEKGRRNGVWCRIILFLLEDQWIRWWLI